MAKQLVCTTCGYIGKSKRITKGNILIELILWLFFLLPGLIYSIWRISSRYEACSQCNGTSLVPLHSPVGRNIINASTQINSIPPESQNVLNNQQNIGTHTASNAPIAQNTQIPEHSEQTSSSGPVVALSIILGLGLVIILPMLFVTELAEIEQTEKSTIAKKQASSIQQSTSSLPIDPQKRIETIVKNLSSKHEVTIFGKNPNVAPVAPFEVIVNTDVVSCQFAKQVNFDVMKNLYSDPVARKNIARIRFNARRYLSTSLGGDDAREMSTEAWKNSGPTNLLKVLSQMGSGDLSYKAMERQTWAKELEGC